MILEQSSLALNNVPLKAKKYIHAINMFNNDYIMSCSTKIPSVENTPKNIYPDGNILDEFASMYYDNNNDNFRLLFQKYTASDVDKMYHPSIFKEQKANMDKEAYEEKLHFVVYMPSKNR